MRIYGFVGRTFINKFQAIFIAISTSVNRTSSPWLNVYIRSRSDKLSEALRERKITRICEHRAHNIGAHFVVLFDYFLSRFRVPPLEVSRAFEWTACELVHRIVYLEFKWQNFYIFLWAVRWCRGLCKVQICHVNIGSPNIVLQMLIASCRQMSCTLPATKRKRQLLATSHAHIIPLDCGRLGSNFIR